MPQEVIVAEREWARVLARHVVRQLPEAVRQVPDLQLTHHPDLAATKSV